MGFIEKLISTDSGFNADNGQQNGNFSDNFPDPLTTFNSNFAAGDPNFSNYIAEDKIVFNGTGTFKDFIVESQDVSELLKIHGKDSKISFGGEAHSTHLLNVHGAINFVRGTPGENMIFIDGIALPPAGFSTYLASLTDNQVINLSNMGIVSISQANWAHMADMDQGVNTTDDVTVHDLAITGDLSVTGTQTLNGNLSATTATFSGTTTLSGDVLLTSASADDFTIGATKTWRSYTALLFPSGSTQITNSSIITGDISANSLVLTGEGVTYGLTIGNLNVTGGQNIIGTTSSYNIGYDTVIATDDINKVPLLISGASGSHNANILSVRKYGAGSDVIFIDNNGELNLANGLDISSGDIDMSTGSILVLAGNIAAPSGSITADNFTSTADFTSGGNLVLTGLYPAITASVTGDTAETTFSISSDNGSVKIEDVTFTGNSLIALGTATINAITVDNLTILGTTFSSQADMLIYGDIQIFDNPSSGYSDIILDSGGVTQFKVSGNGGLIESLGGLDIRSGKFTVDGATGDTDIDGHTTLDKVTADVADGNFTITDLTTSGNILSVFPQTIFAGGAELSGGLTVDELIVNSTAEITLNTTANLDIDCEEVTINVTDSAGTGDIDIIAVGDTTLSTAALYISNAPIDSDININDNKKINLGDPANYILNPAGFSGRMDIIAEDTLNIGVSSATGTMLVLADYINLSATNDVSINSLILQLGTPSAATHINRITVAGGTVNSTCNGLTVEHDHNRQILEDKKLWFRDNNNYIHSDALDGLKLSTTTLTIDSSSETHNNSYYTSVTSGNYRVDFGSTFEIDGPSTTSLTGNSAGWDIMSNMTEIAGSVIGEAGGVYLNSQVKVKDFHRISSAQGLGYIDPRNGIVSGDANYDANWMADTAFGYRSEERGVTSNLRTIDNRGRVKDVISFTGDSYCSEEGGDVQSYSGEGSNSAHVSEFNYNYSAVGWAEHRTMTPYIADGSTPDLFLKTFKFGYWNN